MALSSAPSVAITSFTQSEVDSGSVIYVHDGGQSTSDSFAFTCDDGTGTTSSGVFAISVTGVNDVPVATDGKFDFTEDTVLSNSLSSLASDADGDQLTFVVETQPTHGTLTLNADGKFTYTPSLNYNGDDKFSYRVLDGRGGISSALITLTGKAVNDAPTSTGLSLSVSEDPSNVLTISEAALLGGVTDVEGDKLEIDTVTLDGSLGFSVNGDDIKIDTSAYQSLRARASISPRRYSGWSTTARRANS